MFEVISQAVVLKVPDAVPVELDGVATAIVCGWSKDTVTASDNEGAVSEAEAVAVPAAFTFELNSAATEATSKN